MGEQEDDKPKWLLELENRTRKQRLGHETGAGAPCLSCESACPGLDLHFWRKICKNCKCRGDDHDFDDDEFPQFELLFGPNVKRKKKNCSILLKVNEKQAPSEMSFEWVPPDTTQELAADYMKALPFEKLPITGSAGAALRRQQLQKQLPLHDIDHKACDTLSEDEKRQFDKYLDSLKRCAGQGKVSKLTTIRPFDPALMTPANATDVQQLSPQHTQQLSRNLNCPVHLRTPSSFIPSSLRSPQGPRCPDAALGSMEFLECGQPTFLGVDDYTRMTNGVFPGGLSSALPKGADSNPSLDFVRTKQLRAEKQLNNRLEHLCRIRAKALGERNLAYTAGVPGTYHQAGARPLTSRQQGQNHSPDYNTTPYQFHRYRVPDLSVHDAFALGKPVSRDDEFLTNLRPTTIVTCVRKDSGSSDCNPPYRLSSGTSSDSSTDEEYDQDSAAQRARGSKPSELRASPPVARIGEIRQSQDGYNTTPYAYHLYEDQEKPRGSAAQRAGESKPSDSKVTAAAAAAARAEKVGGQIDQGLEFSSDLPANNAQRAGQLLSEALQPPSAVNAGGIVGSSLDEQGLAHIREKLSDKYNNSRSQPAAPMLSRGLEHVSHYPAISASEDIKRSAEIAKEFEPKPTSQMDVCARSQVPAAAVPAGQRQSPYEWQVERLPVELDTSLAVQSSLIHSEALNNPVFPEEAVGAATAYQKENHFSQLPDELQAMKINAYNRRECARCEEDIYPGQVVVTADKIKDAVWHPGCFKCCACNELLVDLVYFTYKGKLYCGRDLAILLEIPRCYACDELIFVREYTVAEGNNYHVKHFCCWDCDTPLANQLYVIENDRPLCLPCYQKYYAKTCNACNGVIGADQKGVSIKDLNYHAYTGCFCCVTCKKSLLGGQIAIKENKLLCSKECIMEFFHRNKMGR